MRKFICLWLYIKRILKKPAMWLLIAIMPVVSIFISGLGLQNKESVTVGVVAESEDMSSVIEGLENKAGIIKFTAYSDRAELIKAVENTTLDCGYIFPENMLDILKSGDIKKSILVVESPSTILSAVADEAVFSEVLKFWSSELAVEFLSKYGISADSAEVRAKYEGYIANGDTFEMDIEKSGQEEAKTDNDKATAFGTRGVLAVFMLMGALLGAILWIDDEKRGLRRGGIYNIAAIEVLLGLSAMVTICVLNGISAYEVATIVLYGILLIGFGACIKYLAVNSAVICGMLPVFAIGSLVFAPVFFDLGGIIKAFGVAEKIFAPSYYLRALESVAGFKILLLAVLAVNVFALILKKVFQR